MKKKNLMRVLLGLFVVFIGVTVTTGCSCTQSMCTEQDEQSVKQKIEEKNIETWKTNYEASNPGSVAYVDDGEGGLVKSDGFKNFVDGEVEAQYKKWSKACLVTHDDVDPDTGATIEAKTWKDAWKTGLLEGLIVFPIAWLMSTFTDAFNGSGASQLLAILMVVIIIRLFMLLINFKGQLSNVRMQEVQGEISEISAKLKDPNLTQDEKNRLSAKMMDIYKKNNINPFSSLLTTFISFPLFIAVWAAMRETLAIRKGVLFGLQFGVEVNTQIFQGNIAAIVLFVLMIAGQVVSMLLPKWLKKAKDKKNPDYKKKAKSDTEKQMNMMLILMIVMVVTSGFVLPAALVIYWFLGSLFTILQTYIFSLDSVKQKLNALANRKKKAKVIK